jgi:hypothetical protein
MPSQTRRRIRRSKQHRLTGAAKINTFAKLFEAAFNLSMTRTPTTGVPMELPSGAQSVATTKGESGADIQFIIALVLIA